jgi:hypothetical protein
LLYLLGALLPFEKYLQAPFEAILRVFVVFYFPLQVFMVQI